MPRKEQSWIAFQSSDEERQILEQICPHQRSKTEILREMIRQMGRSSVPTFTVLTSTEVNTIEIFEDLEEEAVMPSVSF